MIFLEYITTSHVNSVERWRDHKAETWYSRQKFMFTIIWNPSGFYIVDRLQNDTKMNNGYLVTNIPTRFEQAIFPRGRASHQKWFMIHLDNCSVHTSRTSTDWLEEHGMRRMSHLSNLFTWFGPLWLLLVSYSERKTRTDSDGWRGPVFECL
jgi:hypothetical protein